MRYKTIYIAGINRSGGSLLSRLFDGHPDILSYPTELGFPIDNNFYEITDSYSGIPQTIPDINFNKNNDFYSILDIPKQKHEYSTTWGKETADPLGVRDNYSPFTTFPGGLIAMSMAWLCFLPSGKSFSLDRYIAKAKIKDQNNLFHKEVFLPP